MPWYQRWRNLFRPERVDEALDDELQYHIAETVDRLVEKGMTEGKPSAKRAAAWATMDCRRSEPET